MQVVSDVWLKISFIFCWNIAQRALSVNEFTFHLWKNTNTWKISIMRDTRVTKPLPWPTLCMKYTKGTKPRIDGTDLVDCKSSSLQCTWSDNSTLLSPAKFLIVTRLKDTEIGTGKSTGYVNVILSHYLYGSSLLATNLNHVSRMPTLPGCYYLMLHWN